MTNLIHILFLVAHYHRKRLRHGYTLVTQAENIHVFTARSRHTFYNMFHYIILLTYPPYESSRELTLTVIKLLHAHFIYRFQPVLHDWYNRGHGMCCSVCGMVHIKEPLLLIGKSCPCGFPLLLSEWSVRRHITVIKMCWVCR